MRSISVFRSTCFLMFIDCAMTYSSSLLHVIILHTIICPFSKHFKFCTFLPKFSIILHIFFALFLKKLHTCPYFLGPVHILKSALLPHANAQSPGVIAYLHVDYTTYWMSLCTSLAVYNQVNKLITCECASVLGQKKSAAHRRVGVLQTVFWLSGKYIQDLRFAHRTRKFQNIRTRFLPLNLFESNFLFTFIRGKFPTHRHGKQINLKWKET